VEGGKPKSSKVCQLLLASGFLREAFRAAHKLLFSGMLFFYLGGSFQKKL
jgi:hypothetical protein